MEHQKRFENGTFKISYPPYGYDWDGEAMTINPEQAQIVRRIFSETLAGKGTAAIAAELNREQIPTKRGGAEPVRNPRDDRKRNTAATAFTEDMVGFSLQAAPEPR